MNKFKVGDRVVFKGDRCNQESATGTISIIIGSLYDIDIDNVSYSARNVLERDIELIADDASDERNYVLEELYNGKYRTIFVSSCYEVVVECFFNRTLKKQHHSCRVIDTFGNRLIYQYKKNKGVTK